VGITIQGPDKITKCQKRWWICGLASNWKLYSEGMKEPVQCLTKCVQRWRETVTDDALVSSLLFLLC